MTLHTVVNAAYNPQLNGFEVPAAILLPPMLDGDGDPAVNFCRIGAVVGQEMMHGLDSFGQPQGRTVTGILLQSSPRKTAQSVETGGRHGAALFGLYGRGHPWSKRDVKRTRGRVELIFLSGALWALIAASVIATLLPLSKIAHGSVRSLEFPRLQIIAVQLLMIPAACLLLNGTSLVVALALLGATLALQVGNVVRFTPIWHSQSVQADSDLAAHAHSHVSILSANVKMSNTEYGKLSRLLDAEKPDIFIGLEVDAPWVESLQGVASGFEHRIERPIDNSYGMVVYSRLPMEEIEVRNLLVDDVPSVKAIVRTRSGLPFRLYAIHPEPPVINHDSEGRDAEIGLVGMEAKDDPLPSLVVGDINDVAWSATTRRFQRLSGLLDPRVGRGFFNTFDARYRFLRWPLDHLFHDPEFRLIDMRRGPDIGSDHFPMMFTLALTTRPEAEDIPDQAPAEEEAEMKDMIDSEKKKDRDAIGSDWEK